MKLNWGKSIFIIVGFFMITVISFVIFAVNQDVVMVTDNYYQLGNQTDQQIARIANFNRIADQFKIVYDSAAEVVGIRYTEKLNGFNGNLHFYRPSDDKLDVMHALQLDSSGDLRIPTNQLAAGKWRVKVLLKDQNQSEYYTDFSFMK